MATIHPTAIVDSAAELADDVSIGPYAVICGDVRIGEGSVIGPHAVIHPYTTLGARCRLHAHAVVGDVPQDLSFEGARSYVEVGDDCVIREDVTIHRGTKEETKTSVGNGCYLMANSHLGHNVRLGDKVILVNGALLGGYVDIGDGAFISGNAAVHQFVRVGRLAMVGGLSAVTVDVPPFCTLRTASLNIVTGLNTVGLKRAGLSPDDRKAVKKAYKILYHSGLNRTEAVEQIRGFFEGGPAREFADFVAASERGVCSKTA